MRGLPAAPSAGPRESWSAAACTSQEAGIRDGSDNHQDQDAMTVRRVLPNLMSPDMDAGRTFSLYLASASGAASET